MKSAVVHLARFACLVLAGCHADAPADAGSDVRALPDDVFAFDDVAVNDELPDAASPPMDVAVLPPDARVPCGSRTCRSDQACVQDCCQDTCAPMPDGGHCPDGATATACGAPGETRCLTPCVPPAPRCVDVPGTSCSPTALCGCFDQNPCAGDGICFSNQPTPRRWIRCDCNWQ